MPTCLGCSEEASDLQCPLCQAVGSDTGFFCTQECFATNFRAHRDAEHPAGVVRQTSRRSTEAKPETRKSSQRKAREPVSETRPTLGLWPPHGPTHRAAHELTKKYRAASMADASSFAASVAKVHSERRFCVVARSSLQAAEVAWNLRCLGKTSVILTHAQPELEYQDLVESVWTRAVGKSQAVAQVSIFLPAAFPSSLPKDVHVINLTDEVHPPNALAVECNEHHECGLADGLLLTCLVSLGDPVAFVEQFWGYARHQYALHELEEIMTNSMLCDRGDLSSQLGHEVSGPCLFLHKALTILRLLIDKNVATGTTSQSDSNSSSKDYARMAGRCVARTISRLGCRLNSEGFSSPYLEASLCYILRHISITSFDEIAAACGVAEVVRGQSKLEGFHKLRAQAVHGIRMQYANRLGAEWSKFLVTLMHFIFDFVRHCSQQNRELTVSDLDKALIWSAVLAPFCGPLSRFLDICGLINKTGALRVIKASSLKLPRIQLPLAECQNRHDKLLHQMALEEVLSNMPNTPVMIGDVGQWIGPWTAFNGKFQGRLPTTLKQFLEAHPKEFRVAGTLVNRITAGSQRIPIRFRDDRNEEEDSEEDEPTKKRRKLEAKKRDKSLAGANRHDADLMIANALGTKKAAKLGGRARKKKLKSLRNQARFNKNKKAISDDRRVKGYSTPGARKIKGRGTKVNIRNFKR